MDNSTLTKKDLQEFKNFLIEEIFNVIKQDNNLRYLAKKDVCKYLHISNNTLDKWISQGFPVLRINGVLRFDRVTIDKWLANRV